MMPAPTAMTAISQPTVPATLSFEDQRLQQHHAEADRRERQQHGQVAARRLAHRSGACCGSTAQKAA